MDTSSNSMEKIRMASMYPAIMEDEDSHVPHGQPAGAMPPTVYMKPMPGGFIPNMGAHTAKHLSMGMGTYPWPHASMGMHSMHGMGNGGRQFIPHHHSLMSHNNSINSGSLGAAGTPAKGILLRGGLEDHYHQPGGVAGIKLLKSPGHLRLYR